jgi:hypothetical protein
MVMRSRFTAAALTLALVGVMNGIPAQGQSEAKSPPCGRVKTDAGTGFPKWLEGCGSVAPSAPPEEAARAALEPLAASLGLLPDGSDLTLVDSKQAPSATNVRFRQVHKGVPVYLGEVLVKYGQAGEVLLVNNQTLPNLDVDVTPALTADEATGRALAEVNGSDQLRAPTASDLVIYGDGVEPTLAWHVVVRTAEPAGDWHAMVNAADGSIIALWDEIRRDTGSGLVYDPNAVQQTGNTGLRDLSDATSAALDSARVMVTLSHLDAGTKLKGSYADLTGPGVTGCSLPYTPGTASEATRVYNYTRADDRFEEATTYAAIDGVQSWFQSLGFTNVNNRSIPVDVHCISADNSYYDDGDKALHFGDGGVDDAEDADISIHEYGHSVQDNQVPGWGPGSNNEQRAMGEGFGDFLAGLYYVNKGNATFMTTYKYCIGEWDATSYNPVVGGNSGSGCLRWINGKSESNGADIGAYSGTPSEEHNDGRFWSAALTCMYTGMAPATARDNIMKLVLASHFDLVPTTSITAMDDAVAALVLEDQTLFGGANHSIIASCAASRLNIVVPALPDTPADFDGDGDTDVSVFRPSNNSWNVQGQSTVFFGLAGDIPVPADYDGDGDDDIAVFRPSVGGWYVMGQSPVFFGLSTDIPVPADYDGDGDDDIAVFRPSVGGWYILGQSTVFLGVSGDIPVPAEYDADVPDDIAVFRPSVGGWYIQGSSTVFHGVSGDIPVPGQYDADAADDLAVFRRPSGAWFIQGSSTVFYGLAGDVPLPLANRVYRFFTFA